MCSFELLQKPQSYFRLLNLMNETHFNFKNLGKFNFNEGIENLQKILDKLWFEVRLGYKF